MTQIQIAFCQHNSNLADLLEKNIPEIEFLRLSDALFQQSGEFPNAILASNVPVLLLITDNFIKSEQCMAGMHSALLSLMRQNRVMAIIANGTRIEDGQVVPVETHIDRVVYAIQYMNYWQQQYLALSDQYNHSDDEHRNELFLHQQVIHDIADQAGELISALRDIEPTKWDYLSATGFKEVYKFAGVSRLSTSESAAQPESAPIAPQPMPEPTTITATPVSGIMFRPVEDHPTPSFEPSSNQFEPEIPDPYKHLVTADLRGAENETDNGGHYVQQEIEHTITDAWAWIERGNRELGLEVLRVAMEQYPTHTQLRIEYEKALNSTEEESPSGDEAISYEAAGESAFSDGDYLMAKYCWDRATEANPNLPGIWRKLGLLTSSQLSGYTETSVIYLQKALEQDPNDHEVLERLSELGINVPEHAAAAPVVEQAVAVPETATPIQNTTPEIPVAIPVTEPAAVQQSALTHQRNEIVLITGATSGIGRATAVEFARHGYRLIVTGRRAERLFDLRTELENTFGVEVLPLVFDVRDQRVVEATLTQLPESWQNIDILINNAGLAKGLAPIHEGELHHWETMIDTNIKGLLYVSQIVSRIMVARRKGHIVNLSSSAGKEAYPNGNVYCATKFAVEALTKSMRFDLHKFGIRVSQVSPGHVEETEFAITRFDGNAEKAQIYNDFQPLTAKDVAEAIWFIASRPAHVNVQDVYMFGTQQASATVVDRSGRS